MPRYKSSERDESSATIYKDVCNPITVEYREELYTYILEAYERVIVPEQEQAQDSGKGTKSTVEIPEFWVTEIDEQEKQFIWMFEVLGYIQRDIRTQSLNLRILRT